MRGSNVDNGENCSFRSMAAADRSRAGGGRRVAVGGTTGPDHGDGSLPPVDCATRSDSFVHARDGTLDRLGRCPHGRDGLDHPSRLAVDFSPWPAVLDPAAAMEGRQNVLCPEFTPGPRLSAPVAGKAVCDQLFSRAAETRSL